MTRRANLEVAVPRWAVPQLRRARYKGAKGGRASGKSHFKAERVVLRMFSDPDLRVACVREHQRSLRYSAKALIEAKVKALGLERYFDLMATETRRRGGSGVAIYEGMKDHTADSIKSLENFGLAWVEEAQRLSQRSLDLLVPTIRAPGSELWFTWNPDQPEDPVDAFFDSMTDADDFVLTHCNYMDNPWCPDVMYREAARLQRVDPTGYAHIWLGEYNLAPEVQVLFGKWTVDEFTPGDDWDGPYYGMDFGFSQDPTTIVRVWMHRGYLFIEYDPGGTHWDLDTMARNIRSVPGAADHVIRADNARPETINELNLRGFRVEGADKWQGSVEDGISWLRSTNGIIIHPRCTATADEARLWRYKTDRLTGDPLPKLEDGNEHRWDATRYALAPLIRHGDGFEFWVA